MNTYERIYTLLVEAKRGGSRRRSSKGSKGSQYQGDQYQATTTIDAIAQALANDRNMKRAADAKRDEDDRELRKLGIATDQDVRYDANLDRRIQRRQPTIANLRGK
tara:strand:+ start:82 stop:399 length:318 start_codon:yes stop_codon:yes gene_type:complete